MALYPHLGLPINFFPQWSSAGIMNFNNSFSPVFSMVSDMISDSNPMVAYMMNTGGLHGR
jgi:hypothetical protein